MHLHPLATFNLVALLLIDTALVAIGNNKIKLLSLTMRRAP